MTTTQSTTTQESVRLGPNLERSRATRYLGFTLMALTFAYVAAGLVWFARPARAEGANENSFAGPAAGDSGLWLMCAGALVLGLFWVIWSLISLAVQRSYWQLPVATAVAGAMFVLIVIGTGNEFFPVATAFVLSLMFGFAWLVWAVLAVIEGTRTRRSLDRRALQLCALPAVVIVVGALCSQTLEVRVPAIVFSGSLNQLAASAPVVDREPGLQERLGNADQCVGRLCFDSVGRFSNGLTVMMLQQWTPMFPADGATAHALVKSPAGQPTEAQLKADLPPGYSRSIASAGNDWYLVEWNVYSG